MKNLDEHTLSECCRIADRIREEFFEQAAALRDSDNPGAIEKSGDAAGHGFGAERVLLALRSLAGIVPAPRAQAPRARPLARPKPLVEGDV